MCDLSTLKFENDGGGEQLAGVLYYESPYLEVKYKWTSANVHKNFRVTVFSFSPNCAGFEDFISPDARFPVIPNCP